jgi:hypothetical protein
MRFDIAFRNRKTGERRDATVTLCDDEIVEARASIDFELYAKAFALKHAYKTIPDFFARENSISTDTLTRPSTNLANMRAGLSGRFRPKRRRCFSLLSFDSLFTLLARNYQNYEVPRSHFANGRCSASVHAKSDRKWWGISSRNAPHFWHVREAFCSMRGFVARCVVGYGSGRTLSGMKLKHDARLEIRMPAARRRELDELADEAGLSAADLARLGIRWLLEHRDVLLKPIMGTAP